MSDSAESIEQEPSETAELAAQIVVWGLATALIISACYGIMFEFTSIGEVTETTAGGEIESISQPGYNIEVTLSQMATAETVDEIVVINPSGSLATKTDVHLGVQSITIDDIDQKAGQWTILSTANGEITGRATYTYEYDRQLPHFPAELLVGANFVIGALAGLVNHKTGWIDDA